MIGREIMKGDHAHRTPMRGLPKVGERKGRSVSCAAYKTDRSVKSRKPPSARVENLFWDKSKECAVYRG